MRIWLLVLGMSFAQALSAEPAPAWRTARINYVTGATVYIDAGTDDGIDVGHVIEVVRDGAVVMTLRVTYVSSHRASCERVSGDVVPAVGEAVRYVPRATAPPQEPAWPQPAPGAGETPAPTVRRDLGLHGRVGVRYLAVRSQEPRDEGFSQPALDLRVDGTQIGGAPIDLSVDVRSRTTYQTSALGDDTDSLTSVYRMAVSYHDPGVPWRVTVGRTLSPSLAAIDIFDGVEVQFNARRWNTGVFGGTQPQQEDLGYSSDIQEYGGYVGFHGDPTAARRWSVTTGLIGSYAQGEINREFGYLQTAYNDHRLSVWLAQEVDLNRGWKKEAEEESVSLSSTFVNLRFRAGTSWTLFAGYDNRRNVRLYRDLVTPVTAFDDQYRQGVRAGALYRFLDHFTIGADLRLSDGGSAGSADGYTVSLGADRLTRMMLQCHARSTRYTNDRVEGWLHSLSTGMALGSRWYVEAHGGVRDEINLTSSLLDSTLTWYGLGVDVNLGRQWYASVSAETSTGGEADDQVYSSVTFRF